MLEKPLQTKQEFKHNHILPDTTYSSQPKRHYRNKIPKIANKEIPLHNFGINLAHIPLSKQNTIISKVWHIPRKQSNVQQQRPRSLYNRPVQLLKHYLQRKQKSLYHPLINTNPQTPLEQQFHFKQFIRTTNEFRVKKTNRKLLAVQSKNPVINELQKMKYHSEREEMDFTNPNISKNIYQMTYQQLEQSIRWKKHFLQALTQKVRQSKTSRLTQRSRN